MWEGCMCVCILVLPRGALDTTNIIIRNGLGDSSSNP